MKGRIHWLVAIGSAALYVASLFLPVAPPFKYDVVVDDGSPRVMVPSQPGYIAFRESWKFLDYWDPLDSQWWSLGAPWLAHPVIWVGMILMAAGCWRGTAITGGCALILALLPITQFEARIGTHVGYWAWTGCAAILFGCGVTGAVLRRRER